MRERAPLELYLEIVKTIAVVSGISIAVWELLLKDRERDRIASASSLELIKTDLSNDMVGHKERFFELYTTHMKEGENLSIVEASEIHKSMLPLFQYFIAFESCIASGICNESVGKKYLCGRMFAFNNISQEVNSALKYDSLAINSQYYDLLERCK